MKEYRPKKRLGQHFLCTSHVPDRMIKYMDIQTSDFVVEIGSGLGALTLPLMERASRLAIVELDADCLNRLKPQLNPDIECLEQDALTVSFDRWGVPIRLVGNLPYQISSPFLFHCLNQLECIVDMHFMLQKEVVERMAAVPGSRTYGRLSVMIQRFCQVKFLFTVPPSAFNPPPKVDSAVCSLIPRSDLLEGPIADRFALIVKTAFMHKRKQLGDRLKPFGLSREELTKMGIDPSVRAEVLEVMQYDALAHRSLEISS